MNLEKVLSETQLSLVIEKVLQVLVFLHEKKIFMNNLHPNNVFVSNQNDGEILITDVGLNQLEGLQASKLSVHTPFIAPE